MAKTPPVAAFNIPLTDLQLVRLGRISAIWSQVDFFVDQLLMRIHDLNPEQMRLLVGEKMVGGKIDLIARSLDHIGDTQKRRLVEDFVKLAGGAKAARNHAMHGVWGWRLTSRGEHIAARHASNPSTSFRPEGLARIERDLALASLAGQVALSAWVGVNFVPDGRFNFGASETPSARFGSNVQPIPSGRAPPDRKTTKKEPPRRS